MTTITPLNALDMIPDNSDLEAIEVRLLKIDPQKAFGNGTLQSAFAEDIAGNKAAIRFMDYTPLTADWCGPWLRINATRNGKNELTGLTVDSYNGRKRINVKGADQHGRQRTEITWLEGVPAAPAPTAARPPVRQGPPAHRDDIVYDNQPQQPARAPMGPPPRQAGPPPQAARPAPPPTPAFPSRPPVPAGPPGEAVGLAIKLVLEPLLKNWANAEGQLVGSAEAFNDPEFWRACHRGCSEVLRLSEALKGGDIAPSIVTASLPDYPAEEAAAATEEWPA